MTHITRIARPALLAAVAGVCAAALYLVSGSLTPAVEAQAAPRYYFDPAWPKALPNKWKMGGVTGLAVDKDDNVWVLNRPNDTLDIEGHAGLNPPTADCCRRPPALIHIDKHRRVIASFDAMQGHGMDVVSPGFVYVGSIAVG